MPVPVFGNQPLPNFRLPTPPAGAPPAAPTDLQQFTRPWKLWRLMFPGSQAAAPARVLNAVLPTADVMKASLNTDVRMVTERVITAAVAIGTNTNNHTGPPKGFIRFPIHFSAHATDGAAFGATLTNAFFRVSWNFSAGVDQDPWGCWTDPGVTPVAITDVITSNVAGSRVVELPITLPIPRGCFVSVDMVAAAALGQFITIQWALDIPGELVDAQLMVRGMMNAVQVR